MRAGGLIIAGFALLMFYFMVDGASFGGSSSIEPSSPSLVGATGRVQVVELYADWCGACRASADDVKAVEESYAGQADFIYLDVDDSANRSLLRNKFNRSNAIPTFYLLAPDGTILEHWVGMPGKSRLSSGIDSALQRFPPVTSTIALEQALDVVRGSIRVANTVNQ